MRVLRWPGRAPAEPCRRSVVTLGVFDGVHRGHARVIGRVTSEARRRGCVAAVVTFDRHPDRVLHGRSQPAITSLEHRLRLFGRLGVGLCVVVGFSRGVAELSADDFARQVFCDLLHAELVVLGFDCRFGRGARGDVELCRGLGLRLGFDVQSVAPVEVDGRPISSTAIREAVLRGDLKLASELLGRPFSLYGTVVRGDGRGRGLGFPTANLDPGNEAIPPSGVYASRAFVDSAPLPAVTSIGRRQTFHREAGAPLVVEVHLIDRSLELLGHLLEVQLIRYIRAQRAFATPDELRRQIARDIEDARAALARDASVAE